jgi:hypothetical protein
MKGHTRKISICCAALGIALILPAALTAAVSSGLSVNIVLEGHASPQLAFAAEVVRHALEEKKFDARISSHVPKAEIQIYLGTKADSEPAGVESRTVTVPSAAESYRVSIPSKKVIVVKGSDRTGAMYGALDLAEQISWAEGDDLVGQIKARSKSPYLHVRGINYFLTTQDIDLPGGAFWSDEYWKEFFDMMARDRYNFLDIHGPCEAVTVGFPDGFCYFVHLADFPKIGVGAERAAKNMARFREIIHMAAERGVKVGYMNYSSEPFYGAWQTRRFGVDERWTPDTQKYLTDPAAVQKYTREAAGVFLKQVPNLWMFGFRIGESGQPEDFYKKTYLEALKDAPAALKIYLRTWIADPEKVREIGSSAKQHLYIEPKYNGEQLGSPYQAALGGREYPPSGSYENYTDYPRNYSIIWQIRAHGTTRVFYWMSPEFARRTVRSCKFGGGVGFSMEPMNAYCPTLDYLHNNPKIDHHFYKWMFQRYWTWNMVWGRTAYDPEVSDRVFLDAFISRFGPTAGPLAYKALVESSKIVPFIYSYHNVGLDHQEFAPEFETGDHAFGVRSRMWQGTRLVPYGGDNEDFLRVITLDRRSMASPEVYIEDLLKGKPSGKMGPFEAAAYLDSAAQSSETQIEEAANLNPSSPENFDCMRKDIDAVAWLGRYYASRIRSVTHLGFYLDTRAHPQLTEAYTDLEHAVSDWDRLSLATEEHYGSVPEYIRMGVSHFRWRDEGRSLGADLDEINNLEVQFRNLPSKEGFRVVLGHVPPYKTNPGKPLKLTVTYATDHVRSSTHVNLFYRNAPDAGYSQIQMTPEDRLARTWTGEIPGKEVVPGKLQYYFQANQGIHGSYGGTLQFRPPYEVFVNNDNVEPEFTYTPPSGSERGKAVRMEVEIRDKAPIRSAYVYYKPMPAYDNWIKVKMQHVSGDRYSASVPLTSEGILYYFEAIDNDGNAANYPDFLKQTPYFVINAWDSGESVTNRTVGEPRGGL